MILLLLAACATPWVAGQDPAVLITACQAGRTRGLEAGADEGETCKVPSYAAYSAMDFDFTLDGEREQACVPWPDEPGCELDFWTSFEVCYFHAYREGHAFGWEAARCTGEPP